MTLTILHVMDMDRLSELLRTISSHHIFNILIYWFKKIIHFVKYMYYILLKLNVLNFNMNTIYIYIYIYLYMHIHLIVHLSSLITM